MTDLIALFAGYFIGGPLLFVLGSLLFRRDPGVSPKCDGQDKTCSGYSVDVGYCLTHGG